MGLCWGKWWYSPGNIILDEPTWHMFSSLAHFMAWPAPQNLNDFWILDADYHYKLVGQMTHFTFKDMAIPLHHLWNLPLSPILNQWIEKIIQWPKILVIEYTVWLNLAAIPCALPWTSMVISLYNSQVIPPKESIKSLLNPMNFYPFLVIPWLLSQILWRNFHTSTGGRAWLKSWPSSWRISGCASCFPSDGSNG